MGNCKYPHKYDIDSCQLGRAGEYRVLSELILRGHVTYKPCVDNGITNLRLFSRQQLTNIVHLSII